MGHRKCDLNVEKICLIFPQYHGKQLITLFRKRGYGGERACGYSLF